jgi:uncharacterized protein YkwD
MRRRPFRSLALALTITASAWTCSCVAPRQAPPPAPRSNDVSEPNDPMADLIRAHNVRRAKAGLPPLFPNPLLEAAASSHAQDMAEHRKMSHKGTDGSSPFDRINRQGYHYRAAAENVAYGFDDSEAVMVGWMKSPGHRRNILGVFNEIGVGRAIAKDGASYWCVTFGTPQSR